MRWDPILTRTDNVVPGRSSVAGTQRWQADGEALDSGSSPLPSFDMPSLEAADPDKTLRRRRVRPRADSSPRPVANATEEIALEDVLEVSAKLDAVGTQEIVAEDILDVIPLRQRVYPNTRITLRPEAPEDFEPTSAAALGLPTLPPPPSWAAPIAHAATYVAPSPPPVYDPSFETEPLPIPASSKPSTIAPVAFDVEPPRWPRLRARAESTFSLETLTSGKRRRLDVAIAVAIGAFVGIFVLGFALRSVSAKPVVRVGALPPSTPAAPTATGRAPIGIARAPVGSPAPVTPAAASVSGAGKTGSTGTPTFDVASLPQAPVGTVSLATTASQHRLFVDGVVAPRGSAVVTCGKHVVRVGSHGHAQVVDVSCGGDVIVGP